VFGRDDNESELYRDILETILRRSALGLIDATAQVRIGPDENVLVIVDQFEELFRFKKAAVDLHMQEEARAFVKLLLEATTQRALPIYVVLTMRSDYLGDCAEFRDLPEALNEGQYLIPRLTRDQWREVIEGPISVGGGKISSRLVQRLLNDVGDDPDQLPVLQHALMRTWDHWYNEGNHTQPIDFDNYTAIGEMSEALSRHADEAYEDLGTDHSKKIAEKVFKCLTERDTENREVRRPTPLSRLRDVSGASTEEVIRVINAFRAAGRSFLMPPANIELREESIIDISHESLIRQWKTLHRWVGEESDSRTVYLRIVDAAVRHKIGEAGLWRNPDLKHALEWRSRAQPNKAWADLYNPEFELADSFLEKSRRWKNYRAASLSAVVATVVGLGTYLFWQQANREIDERAKIQAVPLAREEAKAQAKQFKEKIKETVVEEGIRSTFGLTASESAGGAIWFKATAGNARFFTYVLPQRLGLTTDWYRVLNSESRSQRFRTWGLINDLDCCQPGAPNCPAKSLEETYGFDYCPGDDQLLAFVGKSGYVDPACSFQDASLSLDDPHGPKDLRQSSCDLEFGTSTGVIGFRKFPNPKFNKQEWARLNKGRLDTWAGYSQMLRLTGSSDPPVTRLMDGSIEPPFRIGMSCAACHSGFDPLRPPKDPDHPRHETVSLVAGNQFLRFSQLLFSGMSPAAFNSQLFARSRPGTVDMSLIPDDQILNPTAINAPSNLAQKPLFSEVVLKWRKAKQCPVGAEKHTCWCEPGKLGKCWQKGVRTEHIRHLLFGGEDSIGLRESIQRAYLNTGSCAETALVNHLENPLQLDPSQRAFGQTPFDIGQARRDCAQFRAIEDRLDDVMNFLASVGPWDLHKARGLKDHRDLIEQLDKEFGAGSVDRGKVVFAQKCARCHSSQQGPFEGRNFKEPVRDENGQIVKDVDGNERRLDWLGNDQLIRASAVGTHQARALYSNHMFGHIWEEFGSETLRSRPPDPDIREPSDGGRGYYRNVSLLSVWAHAPFMHNNAIGPELCGGPEDQHYKSPYVDEKGQPLRNPPPCWHFDPSVDGRYKVYKASMHDLLNPAKRVPKITSFNGDVIIKLLPKLSDEVIDRYFDATIVFPAGTPSARIANFRYKEFVNDLTLARIDLEKLKAKYVARYGREKGPETATTIQQESETLVARILDIVRGVLVDPSKNVFMVGELSEVYSNSLMLREDAGHRFGEDLSDKDKQALIAFLATL
jgi:hypothetical protein